MKVAFWILSISVCCSGCVKYQYATIRSDLQTHPDQELSVENDSLKVTYNFKGLNGPLRISVYNKLDIPLYIDWSKSSFIIGDQRVSYWSPNATINAYINTSEIKWTNSIASSHGTITGTISQKEPLSFIPPKSFVTQAPAQLRREFFIVPMSTKKNRKKVNNLIVKSYSYDAQSSPLTFRVFLALSRSEAFAEPIYLDHKFWVSEVIQTMAKPDLFPENGNQFYLNKGTGFGTFVGLAAITGLVIVAAHNEDQNQE